MRRNLKRIHQEFSQQSQESKEAGMTIIEILIVIALIGTIMTIVMTNVLDRSDDAKIDLAKVQAQKLSENLGLYKLNNGRYPSTEEGLDALLNAPPSAKRWKGPYSEADKLLDPWGNTYSYEAIGANRFRLTSAGLDTELGTADDLVYPPEAQSAADKAPETIELQVPTEQATPVPDKD